MYGAQDPGNWQSFTNRPDVKNLPLMEQKSRFLREQNDYQNLMESVRAQVNVGGINNNPIVSVAFDGAQLNSISGFTSQFLVTYTHPIVVTGTPTITIPNGQQGNGTASTIQYDYNAGSSTLITAKFDYTQAANANGTGLVAANVLTLNNELAAGITGQPTTPVDGTYVTETLTWATGTGGVGGVDITATVVVAGGVVTSVIATAATGVYQPGNTLTLAGTNLGGTGNLVVTLLDADFTGDTLLLSSQTSILGGSIVNASDNRPAPLYFSNGATKTAIAS
jgi:hypothetical protein